MRTWTKRDPVKNYFPLPNEIYQLGLSHGAIAIYGYLLRIEDRRTYQCHPSYATIGKAVGTECIESIILREMHRIYLVTYLAICLMTVTLEAVEVLVVMAAFVKGEILEDMTDFQEHIFTVQEVRNRDLVMI